MLYSAPGFADNPKVEVLDDWNKQIQAEFESQFKGNLAGAKPYLLTDPAALPGPPVDAVHWGADPAEPRFCLNDDWAQKLSDWGVRGRENFHNEYCEYTMVTRVDKAGKVRLKRFTATTELAEWWTTVATHDPAELQAMATAVLGRQVSFQELYGSDVGDPMNLAANERRIRFAMVVAGNGQHQDLIDAGVDYSPTGDLNRSNALFMAHPINGLDDLVYIVAFGSQPYVVKDGGEYRRADLYEIFNAAGTTHLACRNADPTAAQRAYDQVLVSVTADAGQARGHQIAFADPIGMYIHSFTSDQLTWKDAAIPAGWTRYSRGKRGCYQRLEFGPGDDEDAFLDEVVFSEGAEQTAISGGYQLAKLMEVGPRMLIGPEKDLHPKWVVLKPSGPVDCRQATVCSKRVRPAQQAYQNQQGSKALRDA